MPDDNEEFVEYPIDGILDLHHFSPKDVKELVPEYISECLRRGITQIRIIHGKGTGTLRRMVHSLLDKSDDVLSYRLDSQSASSWGATLVELRSPESNGQSARG
jgi:DNA-nicking Smr family endonuclease